MEINKQLIKETYHITPHPSCTQTYTRAEIQIWWIIEFFTIYYGQEDSMLHCNGFLFRKSQDWISEYTALHAMLIEDS